jgi:hypothetical protein
VDLNARPRLRDDLELRQLPDGVALLDLRTEAVHILNPAVLNPAAAFVLEGLDGERDLASLVQELMDAVPNLDQAQARADVLGCLAELERLALITAGHG